MKEALSELKAVAKDDSGLAARGVVELAERIWPVLQPIDSSSGMLGTAVRNVLTACIPIFANARLSVEDRQALLQRLFEAIQEDGVSYLAPLADAWGELCATKQIASQWADQLISTVRRTWDGGRYQGYFSGTTPCLSALLKADRHTELWELLQLCPVKMWDYAKYGFDSLLAQGKKADAIQYAEQMATGINQPIGMINEACESVLLSSGLYEEAYRKYGLEWTRRNSNLATFKALAKKYPSFDRRRILEDLIAQSPGNEGSWFATAKDIGEFDLALELAEKSPCDPKTLNRAAMKYLESNPEFATRVAQISLRWLCEGYGYEITSLDVLDAFRTCLLAGEKLGRREATLSRMREIINGLSLDGGFVKSVLKQVF